MTPSRFPSMCSPLLLAAAIGFSLQASAGAQGSLPLCPEDVNARWHDCLGVRREPTGTTYVGEWRDNRYNGLGSLHAPDGGVILSGVWKDMGFVRKANVPWGITTLNQWNSRPSPTGSQQATAPSLQQQAAILLRQQQAAADASSRLPPCPEDPNARWHDCFGARQENTKTTYVGEWRDDKYNGLGTLYAPDGSAIMSGEWKDMGFVRAAHVPRSGPRLQLESQTQVMARPQPHAVVQAPQQHAAVRPHPQQAAIATRPSGKRAALVIGNTKYRHSPALENPTRDAELLAATLRNVGFQSVTVKTDLTREGMILALREFATAADSAEWAMVHFSGHGIEFGGANYLIPVDAQLKADRDIDIEAVNMGQVLNAIEGAKRLRLVVLDACRDNPFASQMRRTMATRSLGRGLGRIEPEAGTLIVYAAKHGETALDGEGGNSPFVEALVNRIQQTPALEVRRLFDMVRDDVISTTKKKQQPFSYGSLSGSEDFYFSR